MSAFILQMRQIEFSGDSTHGGYGGVVGGVVLLWWLVSANSTLYFIFSTFKLNTLYFLVVVHSQQN